MGKPVDDGLRGFARRAVGQADVRGGAAHIESQHAAETAGPRGLEGSHHAARGTRKHRAHGMPAGVASREKSPVRLHDGNAELAGARQFAQIRFHQRTDVGIDHRGGAALILAKLRADLVRGAEINTVPRERLRGRALVRGVLIRMQETNRDRVERGPVEASPLSASTPLRTELAATEPSICNTLLRRRNTSARSTRGRRGAGVRL